MCDKIPVVRPKPGRQLSAPCRLAAPRKGDRESSAVQSAGAVVGGGAAVRIGKRVVRIGTTIAVKGRDRFLCDANIDDAEQSVAGNGEQFVVECGGRLASNEGAGCCAILVAAFEVIGNDRIPAALRCRA